jgi:predicted MPP superfamily phosphohydrolase
VEQTAARTDPDPKALACYGLLRDDTGQMLLRFVRGRPVSQVTEDFLAWVCQRLATEGKRALLLVWDNASWHISQRVRAWIKVRNQAIEVQGLKLVGLDDLWSPCFEPSSIMKGLTDPTAALVLCHNPDAADRPVWSNYRGWILSGHTHGGQCHTPWGSAPILPVKNPRYVAGAIDLFDGRRVYINRGLGYLRRVRPTSLCRS